MVDRSAAGITGGPGAIAVVVCTYRRPDRLDRAVREIFEQIHVDQPRVVIVEDGSDDGGRTDAAIERLEREFGPRISVIRHGTNQGVAMARTTGVAAAVEIGASAICFHDDDDLWEPHRLAAGFAPFADPSVAMTFADQHKIDETFRETGERNVIWSATSRGYWPTIIDALARGRVYFPFQTVMIRADMCRDLLPFLAVRESEDLDFALRAFKLARQRGLRVAHVSEVLAYHVASADSLSATDHNRRIREGVHREILARHVPLPVVDASFILASRVLRPVGVALGRARRL